MPADIAHLEMEYFLYELHEECEPWSSDGRYSVNCYKGIKNSIIKDNQETTVQEEITDARLVI